MDETELNVQIIVSVNSIERNSEMFNRQQKQTAANQPTKKLPHRRPVTVLSAACFNTSHFHVIGVLPPWRQASALGIISAYISNFIGFHQQISPRYSRNMEFILLLRELEHCLQKQLCIIEKQKMRAIRGNTHTIN
jgi:hypothetical protein